ncbi:MAG: class I SAM-dependent methyltransferase [Promethearchaeota archaeon]
MQEGVFVVGEQVIDLSNIELRGRILDIGGGGEGVIGQIGGEKVVAIDIRKSELEEAIDNGDTRSLKIVMDARELKFLEKTFDTATAFFSMMYMMPSDHGKVLQEIHRVLKTNGDFFLWDLTIPKRFDEKKDIFGIILKVTIKDRVISTGYGVRWNREQDIEYFRNKIGNSGFRILESKSEKEIFHLKCKKIDTE